MPLISFRIVPCTRRNPLFPPSRCSQLEAEINKFKELATRRRLTPEEEAAAARATASAAALARAEAAAAKAAADAAAAAAVADVRRRELPAHLPYLR